MLAFLQGFAYGLFLSCVPWFFIGMVNPRAAIPTDPPYRWKVLVRYGFALPFLAVLLWLTSLWGGFGPTLPGWIAGLFAIAVEVPAERGWRRWLAAKAQRRREADAERRRAALEREEREAGIAVLDPSRPPVGADEIVLALCRAKQRLLELHRPELATQTDRLYTRYCAVVETLASKFDPGELTYARSLGTVTEVCRGALDNLGAMTSLAQGVAGIDPAYVRRRLARRSVSGLEREALRQRLELIEDTERRLVELSGRNERVLTALDRAAVAVAGIETGRPQAALAADEALNELDRFVANAPRYARTR